jgi:hypothetical protein
LLLVAGVVLFTATTALAIYIECQQSELSGATCAAPNNCINACAAKCDTATACTQCCMNFSSKRTALDACLGHCAQVIWPAPPPPPPPGGN